jgi:hypothetical protein
MAAEHQMPFLDPDVEHVALTDPKCAPKVGGEHNSTQRVDAARAVLRVHCKPARGIDMRSVS